MKTPPSDTLHRLLFVLHRGFSDVRYLAKDGKTTQAYDLADTLENIPGYMVNWEECYFEQIVKQLENYEAKYKQFSFQPYAKYLTSEFPPESF